MPWKTSLAAVALAVPVTQLSTPAAVVPAATGAAAITRAASNIPRYPDGYRGMAVIGHLAASRPASAAGRPTHKVTIKVLDRRGRAPAAGDARDVVMLALNGSVVRNSPVKNGTATAEVPAGRYSVGEQVTTPGSQKSVTMIYLPAVPVTGNKTLTLDARLGRRVQIGTDNPHARLVTDDGSPDGIGLIYQKIGGIEQQTASFGVGGEPVYVTPAHPLPGLFFRLQGRLTRNGALYGSPYIYNVGVTLPGGIPHHPSVRVVTADMARVRASYASDGKPACAGGHTFAVWPGGIAWGLYTGIGQLPTTRTEYYSPGVTWGEDSAMTTTNCSYASFPDVSTRSGLRFAPGSRHTVSWFQAPSGPGGDFDQRDSNGVLAMQVPLCSSVTASCFADTLTGTTTLRNASGATLRTSHQPGSLTVKLPPQKARYTAIVDASRHVPYSNLSIRQHDVWTFTSKKPARSYSFAPMLEVLYRTALNSHNQARAGARQAITLLPVDGGSDTTPNGLPARLARLRRISLRVSFNDGSTWQTVAVHRTSKGWTADVTNPARRTARFASLRVTAEDTSGRTADQTLIHAYAISHPKG